MGMTLEEREEKRLRIYNSMLFEFQLGLLFAATFGDFENQFAWRMKESSIGECTETDVRWLYEHLDSWNNHCEKERAKEQRKSKKRGSTESKGDVLAKED